MSFNKNTNKRETVGKISTDLLKKDDVTLDPVELQREMHKDYEKNINEAIEFGRNKYLGSFYIVVITKREPLMPNVLRNYFSTRASCPTPDYDQAVYKYHTSEDALEFLWVLPSKEVCSLLKLHALELPEDQRGLLQFVLEDADGTLLQKAKRLNGETSFSNEIEEKPRVVSLDVSPSFIPDKKLSITEE